MKILGGTISPTVAVDFGIEVMQSQGFLPRFRRIRFLTSSRQDLFGHPDTAVLSFPQLDLPQLPADQSKELIGIQQLLNITRQDQFNTIMISCHLTGWRFDLFRPRGSHLFFHTQSFAGEINPPVNLGRVISQNG